MPPLALLPLSAFLAVVLRAVRLAAVNLVPGVGMIDTIEVKDAARAARAATTREDAIAAVAGVLGGGAMASIEAENFLAWIEDLAAPIPA